MRGGQKPQCCRHIDLHFLCAQHHKSQFLHEYEVILETNQSKGKQPSTALIFGMEQGIALLKLMDLCIGFINVLRPFYILTDCYTCFACDLLSRMIECRLFNRFYDNMFMKFVIQSYSYLLPNSSMVIKHDKRIVWFEDYQKIDIVSYCVMLNSR